MIIQRTSIWCRLLIRVTFAWTIIFLCTSLSAAPTPAQRQEAKALEAAVNKAGNLYKDGKFKEAGVIIRDVQERMNKLAAEGGKDVAPLLDTVYSRLLKAHALLELEGVELTELKKPDTMISDTVGGGGTGFLKDVAPILVAKCGRCHMGDSKGDFSMSTFANLMKGPPAGVVIFPGDPVGSRVIEVIESGEMPRGGLKVSPQELETLKKWIQGGAKFDGENTSANLQTLVPAPKPADIPAVALKQATGKETVSFARDIAPILIANCSGCHIGGMRFSGNFNMTTFQGFLRGGDSGPPVKPGDPADSLLVQKLLGKAGGERMPARKPPLEADVIAKIETWIKEGVAFDGSNQTQDIAEVAGVAKANAATHQELSAERIRLAKDNWRLGMPGISAEQMETDNFLVIGNFGAASLAEFGKVAEDVAPKVESLFKAQKGQPLVKGRTTLYFFTDRYSYNEFGKMVERRDVPKEYRGHWRFSTIDAYGAISPPKADEYTLRGLVAQQVAGVYVASLGKTPRWFAEGAARVAAARIDTNDPRVASWDADIPRVLSTMDKPNDFLTGKMSPEDADIASYSFVRFLMKDAKRFDRLFTQMRSGKTFDQAFGQEYGASPAQVAELWVSDAASAKPSKRAKTKKS